ncbi:TPA: hypothetical protein N0F65_002045 [Lagenidium giganteum]|uniref:5'-nucleotidase domain-containing protein 3 n=1 Tax=Lagenidium giganteum TaxID=4803 RepID=A0AAV2ZBF0_9STRA|nr:TPA: hypothetical protein N0F65_002045 [Lagenidium giganteum]
MHMLSKRKSLNDDLIVWHGMSMQNISLTVRTGLPFAMKRRNIWLDIVSADVQKKSKSIVAQNFAFSTRTSISSFSFTKESAEDENSFVHVPMDIRVEEIVGSLSHNLPIRVDEHNMDIVSKLTVIVASEMKVNVEANKVLSFMLYREQIPSNRRPCIPTGKEAYFIYRDILESCIHARLPLLYKHMVQLEVHRDIYWKIFQVCISDLAPMVLRVRFLDLVLVNGCVVLVAFILTYLAWRQDALLKASTAEEFNERVQEDHRTWLKDQELEQFWQKCVETQSRGFMAMYVQSVSMMRLKTVTMAKGRRSHFSLSKQLQQEIFHHRDYSWMGFDVDHTLVEYRLPYLLKASFEAATKELQQAFIGLRAFPPPVWQPEIAQRGVAVDTSRGNFLHIAEDGTIQQAYHGSHEVSYFSISMLYSMYSKQDLHSKSSRIIYMYTAAEIIFAPLYAWIVDAFDAGVITAEEMGASLYLVPDIDERVHENTNDPFLANQLVYVSLSTFALKAAKSYYANAFWKTICSHPDLLILQNPEIREILEMLRETYEKKLFVLTNGSWTHCNEVMKFAIGKDWLSLFDVVLTEANKEIFFDELNDTTFMEVDITNSSHSQKKTVKSLEKNKVYAHGNLKTLMRLLSQPSQRDDIAGNSKRPQRICYFGDHLAHDIYMPSQSAAQWDLVAVIKEIQNLQHNNEREVHTNICAWLSSFVTREAPHLPPDLHSPFFYLGVNGTSSFHGKKVCDLCVLCINSVGKLARYQSILRVIIFQQGMNRNSTRNELVTMTKRVSAKVRAITKI